MASSGVATSSFPAMSMADDSMEISSDHGGLNANDDIDIDIDFMAGTADEDYMLEDQEPELDVEFKESFEAAPQVTNDDVVLDDYTDAFQEDMQDDDERFLDIADDTVDIPDMEVSSSKAPESDGPDRRDSNTNAQGAVVNSTAQLQDNVAKQTSAQPSQTGASNDLGTFEALPPTTQPSPVLQSSIPDATTTSHNSPDPLLNGATNNSSIEQDTLAVESDEAQVMHGNNNENSAEAVPSLEAAEQGENEAAEDNVDGEQVQSDEMEASYADILVSYQDAQYALFSTSEDEDTDSFFLKDRSIVHQPISAFLKALRGILQDELDGDHELCIAVDVLRLEFGETSAEIEKVSFQDLVQLHQQLRRNDGIEQAEPLHFTLGTRPEFAKRFAGLFAGASEGKGLSELIPRDEESESYDEAETSTHVEEDNAQYDQGGDEAHSNDDYEYDIEEIGQENAEPDVQDEYNPEQDHTDAQDEYHFEQDENANSTLELSEERVEREASLDISSVPQGSDKEANIVPPEAEPENEDSFHSEENGKTMSPAPRGDVDAPESTNAPEEKEPEVSPDTVKEQHDEDDLIDYSDEEPDTEPDTKPKAKTPSSTSHNASYEAAEEEYQRRFPPQTTEHASDEDASLHNAVTTETTDTGIEAEDADVQKPSANTYDDDEIDFDFEDDHNDLENKQEHTGEVQSKFEGLEPDNFDDYDTGFDEQGQQGDESRDPQESTSYENGLELDGQDRKESETPKIATSTVVEIASLKSNGASPLEEVSAESVTVNGDIGDADEIDYDEDDMSTEVMNESIVLSTRDPQPIFDSTKTEVIDEIDYDDDDYGVVTPPAQDSSKLQSASSSTPGKRQRSDSMSEVAPGEGNQEAKRVRS